MKPVLEHLPLNPEESFVAKSFDFPYYPTPWHFHPEYEIVLITESTGRRFIGDNISDFKTGDLSILGPNLPHVYRNDDEYYGSQPHSYRAKSIVVHFLEKSFGDAFFSLPEANNIKKFLSRSKYGFDILGNTRKIVIDKLHQLIKLNGFSKLIKLMEILHLLSASEELKKISYAHIIGKNEKESERLNKVFEFVMKNFKQEIRIAEIADKVNLSETSFSRYFSERTKKSFTTFVIEVRLQHASKLLRENKLSVAEVCFASGYNNLSNFNRQFKNLYKVSPLTYGKHFHQ